VISTDNLNKCHTATEFITWLFTNDQKQRCVKFTHRLWEKATMVLQLHFVSQFEKWNWRDDVLRQYLPSKGNCKRYWKTLQKITSIVFLWRGRKTTRYVRCKFPRRLFWRRWHPKLSQASISFLIKSGNFQIPPVHWTFKLQSLLHGYICNKMMKQRTMILNRVESDTGRKNGSMPITHSFDWFGFNEANSYCCSVLVSITNRSSYLMSNLELRWLDFRFVRLET
jgi:hypothetical protein